MSRPAISVVVPTHRRPERLGECLAALAASAPGGPAFEVVVVDDGGPEPLDEVVRPWRERLDLVLLRQERAGPAAARNAGAAAARAPLLAFTDDDCRPAASWLPALVRRLAAAPGALVGGRTENALPGDLGAEASQLLLDLLYERHRPRFFASNNLAATAGRFAELGGFDPSFPLAAGEDRDLSDRWLAAGGRLVYAPEARVLHAHALGVGGFVRQHFRYGRGAHRFHRQRERRRQGESSPTSGSIGPAPPPLLDLLRAPFGARRAPGSYGTPRALALAGLLGLSQVAVAAGYAAEAIAARRGRDGGADGG